MDVFQVAEYKEYLFDTVKKIFGIDSPSGYYHAVVKEVEKIATELGYQFEQIEKGCGIITIEGEDNSRTVMMSAHVDTLGLMVRSITADGNLKFTKIGGPIMPTVNTAASTPEMAEFTPAPSCVKAQLYTFIQMQPAEPEKRIA